MKTTERFEKALSALYNAFHENKLHSNKCSACAVGNILGHDRWYGGNFSRYILRKDPCVEQIFIVGFNNSGYSGKELAIVEYIFMKEVHKDVKLYTNRERGRLSYDYDELKETPETHFNGLCAVVEYLAKLDNIPNPMDYSKVFERTEENSPKYKLEEIL
jgi:hypothetical protein